MQLKVALGLAFFSFRLCLAAPIASSIKLAVASLDEEQSAHMMTRRSLGSAKYISFRDLDKHYNRDDVLFKVKVRRLLSSKVKGETERDNPGGASGGGSDKDANINRRLNIQTNSKRSKSISRRLSHGIKKYPFLSLAAITSLVIGANTWAVVTGIRSKEDKVMKLKTEKGELPIAILPPAPSVAPDPDRISPKKHALSSPSSSSSSSSPSVEATPAKESGAASTDKEQTALKNNNSVASKG
ncbi:hypothetical protein CBS101457_006859 [Exobasidium rhododendri]|nr:hypothetical protein CBS101457_006859 [Exobasidium rhododendri]